MSCQITFQEMGKRTKKDSDHNSMYIELSVNLPKTKTDRNEIFNFKNRECQQTFFEHTSKSTSLSKCFQNNENVQKQGRKWFKNLNGIFQQSFKKIRITSVQKETVISKLFDKRLELIQKSKMSGEAEKETILEKLEEVEKVISEEVAKDIRDKVVENFQSLADGD